MRKRSLVSQGTKSSSRSVTVKKLRNSSLTTQNTHKNSRFIYWFCFELFTYHSSLSCWSKKRNGTISIKFTIEWCFNHFHQMCFLSILYSDFNFLVSCHNQKKSVNNHSNSAEQSLRRLELIFGQTLQRSSEKHWGN